MRAAMRVERERYFYAAAWCYAAANGVDICKTMRRSAREGVRRARGVAPARRLRDADVRRYRR